MSGGRTERDKKRTLRKIGLKPDEIRVTSLGHDAVITPVIGGTRFEAMVPTMSLGEGRRFVPAEQIGRIGNKLILVLPPSNDGTPIWHVREEDLSEVLVS